MRFHFGIGTGLTKDGVVISSSLRALLISQTSAKVAAVFGGCFVIAGVGAWFGPDGNLVSEPGVTVIADTPRDNRTDSAWQQCAAELAEELRVLWDQQAVHLTQSVATSSLIEAATPAS